MLKLFNSYGKRSELFRPVNGKEVSIFTCGPSVYQRSHIGNFRTFLFEDILVRYLEYSGYRVKRGMNFTDIEDKALREALKKKTTLRDLTRGNMKHFIAEMKLLRMKVPDYLPVASEHVGEMAVIIAQLVSDGHAYWYKGSVYFDPLTFRGFGKLYGLDMSSWPTQTRRFHQDTYPGVQWNKGDFILWHGYKAGDTAFWDTPVGRGRPSWNIQDPAMVSRYFNQTLSIYCGGIDNLFRHHDYSAAILESVRSYPMARFWLHAEHLVVRGRKMSKSKGNIYYTDTLVEGGYSPAEIRFFLIYSHYRRRLSFSKRNMYLAAKKLRDFRDTVKNIQKKAGKNAPVRDLDSERLLQIFARHMDNDLDVRGAFDNLQEELAHSDMDLMTKEKAAGIISALRKIDAVLQVLF
ncbi:MAG: class I tRNA ligase family protein [Thermodesulfovibrionales bacterium]